ncbi:hypothetical protein FNF27_06521 [Cafeteria roenbergensis]|uniref:histidine kinase n=1 Tax=Cafeteria roenbergensis TaxID=33653 RepID=A0A5A8DYN1_CAFRO|nr:hypothetical protein FNF27_06521 [Cafeteria roenbergensis]
MWVAKPLSLELMAEVAGQQMAIVPQASAAKTVRDAVTEASEGHHEAQVSMVCRKKFWLVLLCLSPLVGAVVAVAFFLGATLDNSAQAVLAGEHAVAATRSAIMLTTASSRLVQTIRTFHLTVAAADVLRPDLPAGSLSPSANSQIINTACASLRATAETGNQARIINATGFEVARVEIRNASLAALSSSSSLSPSAACLVRTLSELQDKGNRDYFLDAVGLAPGALYVSALDPNIENGEVEIPIRPMLRAAERYVNATTQQTLGVSVVNHAVRSALDGARETIAQHAVTTTSQFSAADTSAVATERILIINSDGGYVIGPTEESEWGWVLGNSGPGYNVQLDSPELWEAIQPVFEAAGKVETSIAVNGLTEPFPLPNARPRTLAGAVGMLLGPGRPYVVLVEGPVRDRQLAAIIGAVVAVSGVALAIAASALRVSSSDAAAAASVIRTSEARAASRKTFLRAIFHDVRVPAQGIVLGLGMLLSEIAAVKDQAAAAAAAAAAGVPLSSTAASPRAGGTLAAGGSGALLLRDAAATAAHTAGGAQALAAQPALAPAPRSDAPAAALQGPAARRHLPTAQRQLTASERSRLTWSPDEVLAAAERQAAARKAAAAAGADAEGAKPGSPTGTSKSARSAGTAPAAGASSARQPTAAQPATGAGDSVPASGVAPAPSSAALAIVAPAQSVFAPPSVAGPPLTSFEQLLNSMRSSSDDMVGILNQVLDIERLESGQMALSRKWFGLQHRLTNTLGSLMGLAAPRRLSLAFAFDASLVVPERTLKALKHRLAAAQAAQAAREAERRATRHPPLPPDADEPPSALQSTRRLGASAAPARAKSPAAASPAGSPAGPTGAATSRPPSAVATPSPAAHGFGQEHFGPDGPSQAQAAATGRAAAAAAAQAAAAAGTAADATNAKHVAAGDAAPDAKPLHHQRRERRHRSEASGVGLPFGRAFPVPMRLCQIFADDDKMHQAVANLLSNAARYSPEGGTITLAAQLFTNSSMVLMEAEPADAEGLLAAEARRGAPGGSGSGSGSAGGAGRLRRERQVRHAAPQAAPPGSSSRGVPPGASGPGAPVPGPDRGQGGGLSWASSLRPGLKVDTSAAHTSAAQGGGSERRTLLPPPAAAQPAAGPPSSATASAGRGGAVPASSSSAAAHGLSPPTRAPRPLGAGMAATRLGTVPESPADAESTPSQFADGYSQPDRFSVNSATSLSGSRSLSNMHSGDTSRSDAATPVRSHPASASRLGGGWPSASAAGGASSFSASPPAMRGSPSLARGASDKSPGDATDPLAARAAEGRSLAPAHRGSSDPSLPLGAFHRPGSDGSLPVASLYQHHHQHQQQHQRQHSRAGTGMHRFPSATSGFSDAASFGTESSLGHFSPANADSARGFSRLARPGDVPNFRLAAGPGLDVGGPAAGLDGALPKGAEELYHEDGSASASLTGIPTFGGIRSCSPSRGMSGSGSGSAAGSGSHGGSGVLGGSSKVSGGTSGHSGAENRSGHGPALATTSPADGAGVAVATARPALGPPSADFTPRAFIASPMVGGAGAGKMLSAVARSRALGENTGSSSSDALAVSQSSSQQAFAPEAGSHSGAALETAVPTAAAGAPSPAPGTPALVTADGASTAQHSAADGSITHSGAHSLDSAAGSSVVGAWQDQTASTSPSAGSRGVALGTVAADGRRHRASQAVVSAAAASSQRVSGRASVSVSAHPPRSRVSRAASGAGSGGGGSSKAGRVAVLPPRLSAAAPSFSSLVMGEDDAAALSPRHSHHAGKASPSGAAAASAANAGGAHGGAGGASKGRGKKKTVTIKRTSTPIPRGLPEDIDDRGDTSDSDASIPTSRTRGGGGHRNGMALLPTSISASIAQSMANAGVAFRASGSSSGDHGADSSGSTGSASGTGSDAGSLGDSLSGRLRAGGAKNGGYRMPGAEGSALGLPRHLSVSGTGSDGGPPPPPPPEVVEDDDDDDDEDDEDEDSEDGGRGRGSGTHSKPAKGGTSAAGPGVAAGRDQAARTRDGKLVAGQRSAGCTTGAARSGSKYHGPAEPMVGPDVAVRSGVVKTLRPFSQPSSFAGGAAVESIFLCEGLRDLASALQATEGMELVVEGGAAEPWRPPPPSSATGRPDQAGAKDATAPGPSSRAAGLQPFIASLSVAHSTTSTGAASGPSTTSSGRRVPVQRTVESLSPGASSRRAALRLLLRAVSAVRRRHADAAAEWAAAALDAAGLSTSTLPRRRAAVWAWLLPFGRVGETAPATLCREDASLRRVADVASGGADAALWHAAVGDTVSSLVVPAPPTAVWRPMPMVTSKRLGFLRAAAAEAAAKVALDTSALIAGTPSSPARQRVSPMAQGPVPGSSPLNRASTVAAAAAAAAALADPDDEGAAADVCSDPETAALIIEQLATDPLPRSIRRVAAGRAPSREALALLADRKLALVRERGGGDPPSVALQAAKAATALPQPGAPADARSPTAPRSLPGSLGAATAAPGTSAGAAAGPVSAAAGTDAGATGAASTKHASKASDQLDDAASRHTASAAHESVSVSGRQWAVADAALVITVSDNGPGIARSKQANIFAPFEQLARGDPRYGGGSGLGLSIARSIIELHGGKIGLHSRKTDAEEARQAAQQSGDDDDDAGYAPPSAAADSPQGGPDPPIGGLQAR